jgi:hypothetical protein
VQGQTYRVVRGDTLSGIAARVADRPMTIRETSDAIFAANPDAFTRGNRDRLEEGRTLVIPVLGPLSTATVVTPSPTIADLAATAAPAPAAAAPPPPAPLATEPPRAADPIPVAAPAVEPQVAPQAEPALGVTPAPAAAASAQPDAAIAAADSAPPHGIPSWLAAILAAGALAVVLSFVAFTLRRREPEPAPKAAAAPRKAEPPRRAPLAAAGIEVVESRPADKMRPEPKATPRRTQPEVEAVEAASKPAVIDFPLEISATESVDLDIGAPLGSEERVPWFKDRVDVTASNDSIAGDETVEEDAATARMTEIDAGTARLASPDRERERERSQRAIDDDRMTMTVVELDMLRQDYEAEHTLTQQLNQELRDAVADLEATKRALAKAGETGKTEPARSPRAASNDGPTDSTTVRTLRR